MKAAVFYAPHDIRIEQVEKPTPGKGEVLVKVMACGICGTDVHIFEGDKGSAETHPPCILGHEFSGIVEQLGEGVSEHNVGDVVSVNPNLTCGNCAACKNGMEHFCNSMVGYGTNHNGGFAQYCVVDAGQLCPMPSDIGFEDAAMVEPLACCLHGIDMCDITPGATVLVIGGGMIGLLMLQLAKISGAATVIVSEPVAAKREQALALGADIAVDPTAGDVKPQLAELGVGRIDTVIECCGLPVTIKSAIELVGYKGTVMMFGLTKPDETVDLKPFTVFEKEITLRSSFINPYTSERASKLIAAKKLDVTSMIDRVIPLEQLAAVLGDSNARRQGKLVVNPWL